MKFIRLFILFLAFVPLIITYLYKTHLIELFTNGKTTLYWVKNKSPTYDKVILGKENNIEQISDQDSLFIDDNFFKDNLDSGIELYIGNSLRGLNKINGDTIQKVRGEILPYHKSELNIARLNKSSVGSPLKDLSLLNPNPNAICFSDYKENENDRSSYESCLTADHLKALKGEMKFKLQNKQWGSSQNFMKIIPEPDNTFETSGMKCGYSKRFLNTENSILFTPNEKKRY